MHPPWDTTSFSLHSNTHGQYHCDAFLLRFTACGGIEPQSEAYRPLTSSEFTSIHGWLTWLSEDSIQSWIVNKVKPKEGHKYIFSSFLNTKWGWSVSICFSQKPKHAHESPLSWTLPPCLSPVPREHPLLSLTIVLLFCQLLHPSTSES